MYSLMSIRTIACSSSKRNSASARAVSVFPTPVGPRKMNEPIGRLGSRQASTRSANRIRDRGQCLVLPDDALAQTILHLHQLLGLAFEHLRHGDAGPFRDDRGDVLLVDLFLQHARRLGGGAGRRLRLVFADGLLLQRGQLAQLGLELRNLTVLQLGGALQIALARLLLHLEAQAFEPLLQLGDAADGSALLLPASAQSRRPAP